MYCSYCGYSYLKHKCKLCNAIIETCGCDPARNFCEEHFCTSCQEPFLELNDFGECDNCKQSNTETEQYYSNDILGFG